MLPPVNTSLPACVHPPERPTDDLPSPTTPDRTAEDSIDETDMIPVARRNRTTRIAGLTARFYKHRRSASMSSYDTRSFKRGGQLSDSLSGTKREMSPFHNRSHGKAEPAQVRASLREGTEVHKYIHAQYMHIYIHVYSHIYMYKVYGRCDGMLRMYIHVVYTCTTMFVHMCTCTCICFCSDHLPVTRTDMYLNAVVLVYIYMYICIHLQSYMYIHM